MTPYRQPFLHELITAVAAPTQVLSAADGSIGRDAPGSGGGEPSAEGIIHADVRVVSGLELTVDGRRPEHIATYDGFSVDGQRSTTFVGLIRGSTPAPGRPDAQLRLDRRRVVAPGVVTERLTFTSTMVEGAEIRVELSLVGDGAPIELIKSGGVKARLPIDAVRELDSWVWSQGDDVGITLTAPGARLALTDELTRVHLAWLVSVPASGEVALDWSLALEDSGAVVVAAGGRPLDVERLADSLTAAGPPVADRRLRPWLQRSLADLNSLRMATPEHPEDAFFAAGAPWYLTLFGRDSLWAARLLLPVDVSHAGSTLRTLARRQGTREDVESAEQPGKILHELRRGQFSFGDTSLPPVYYGTVDATLLWVCLLHDAWRAGLADDKVRELLPACRAALSWLTESADADGDGFVEYVDTTGHGLANQGWKDSQDSIRFADGSVAIGSVALVEVQGYAHEAARSGAALLDGFGLDGGDALRAFADELAVAFRAAFWCGDGVDRYPALALDGDKRRVDAVSSNIGHLLGTGILNAEEELLVARRLAAPDLDSGLGLRTMSAAAAGYWPLSYHCGSVWPHDTAIVIAGLTRAGLLDHAGGLVEGLLQASTTFDRRLPELWSGEGVVGVPYPAACRPQAWSAAAAVTVAEALRLGAPLGPAATQALGPNRSTRMTSAATARPVSSSPAASVKPAEPHR